MTHDPNDPKGLIREAYVIDGISEPECRSIFLDWALSVPRDADHRALIRALLDSYGTANPDHPMTATLQAGLPPMANPKRRGGRAGRVSQ